LDVVKYLCKFREKKFLELLNLDEKSALDVAMDKGFDTGAEYLQRCLKL